MQIYNNPQIPSQTNTSQTLPNFKAIKSVKCEGLYKKYPQYAERLVDTFKKNPIAMKFCKDQDVNIVFYACKKLGEVVESSIYIFFKNPAKTKFFGLINNVDDYISISAFDKRYNLEKSLEKSTACLRDYVSENIPGKISGVLDSHIMNKQKEINEYLTKKSKKEEDNIARALKKNYLKIQKRNAIESLKNSINDLINSSK